MLVPALAGMALTGYLTITAWTGAEALYCGAGSSCDEVQGSRWGTLLGLPVSFWGFLAYGGMAWIALRVHRAALHWKLSWSLALLGLGYSVYLTAVSSLVIGALCVYCLVSLALMAGLFGIATGQKPAAVPEFAWPSWLLQTGGTVVVLVVVLHLHYTGVFSAAAGPEDPYLKGLAEHLGESGAKFYGASWCTYCERQKDAFGTSAYRLPYVECSPGGRGAPPNPECVLKNVKSYPTWFISGTRHTQLLTVEELAALSGFQGPRPHR
jgi:uncharacterized membrane protein